METIEQVMLKQQNSSLIFDVSTMNLPSMKILQDNKTVKTFRDSPAEGVKHFYSEQNE